MRGATVIQSLPSGNIGDVRGAQSTTLEKVWKFEGGGDEIDIVQIGKAYITANHPILTVDGWMLAGQAAAKGHGKFLSDREYSKLYSLQLATGGNIIINTSTSPDLPSVHTETATMGYRFLPPSNPLNRNFPTYSLQGTGLRDGLVAQTKPSYSQVIRKGLSSKPLSQFTPLASETHVPFYRKVVAQALQEIELRRAKLQTLLDELGNRHIETAQAQFQLGSALWLSNKPPETHQAVKLFDSALRFLTHHEPTNQLLTAITTIRDEALGALKQFETKDTLSAWPYWRPPTARWEDERDMKLLFREIRAMSGRETDPTITSSSMSWGLYRYGLHDFDCQIPPQIDQATFIKIACDELDKMKKTTLIPLTPRLIPPTPVTKTVRYWGVHKHRTGWRLFESRIFIEN